MSIKLNIYNQNGERTGEKKLSKKIFGVEIKEALVHQAMVAQMSNERQVLAHTKDRSEVRGGGRKPWRQKGTGRARAGSSRSPIWIGGGVTFGPLKTRNFKKDINKKMRQKALQMVLSDKVANSNLVILDKIQVDEFKTKLFNEMIKSIENKVFSKKEDTKQKKEKRSILVINKDESEKAKYSGRNLVGIKIINPENINILDLLKYKNLILTEKIVDDIEDKYNKEVK